MATYGNYEGTFIFDKKITETSGTSKAGKDWRKGQYQLHTEGQYPKTVVMQAFGDKNLGWNDITPGSKVHVEFDIESREWNGKFFTDVSAIIVKLAQPAPAPAPAPQPAPAPVMSNEDEDLPF